MADMLTMTSPGRLLPAELLDKAGGFVWWYADIIDAHGNGIVLIWSYGLPFLPGVARAARDGAPQRPSERPSVNVAIYREGALDFYLLQEYESGDASWNRDEESWTFGDSRFCRKKGDEITLSVDLNCPIPGSDARLTGRVEISGRPRRGVGIDPPYALEHDWTPLMGPAKGTADLRAQDSHWTFEGRGYHDRNGGTRPLHDLGMNYWLWGRAPFETVEKLWYLVWPHGQQAPEFLGIEIDEDGSTRVIDDLCVELNGPRRAKAGMLWWSQLRLTRSDGSRWLDVEHERIVDDGPFYLRFQARVSDGCQETLATAELCRPDNIDMDILRPLVRMRVHHTAQDNSIWLPLFTGPRDGRIRRLFRSWLRGPQP